jgi:polysaccharide export outer membrane protein
MRLNLALNVFPLCVLFGIAAFSQDQAPTQRPAATLASRDPRYCVQPDDVIEIQFRYTPEFNFSAVVQPDGYVSSQITGDIHVGGLTLAAITALVTQKASPRLRDPELAVVLKDFVKPHFVVAGEVAHPGTFELRGEIGLIQAIAMSGGFLKDSAKTSQVILVRRADSEYSEVKVFNLKKMMSPGKIREDVFLRSDDMLVVPRNAVSKIDPFIRISSLALYGLGLGLP